MADPLPRILLKARIPPALDDVELMAITAAMEAASESDRAKLGVAWAIRNRADLERKSIPDVVFARAQFSSWTTGSVTLLWLDTLDVAVLWKCRRAAAAAYYDLLPDPTQGASHYLNPELTKQLREKQGLGRTLPAWACKPGQSTELDEARVLMRDGSQVWLRVP